MTFFIPEETKPMRAARRFCLACQGGQPALVRTCTDQACALFCWRLPEDLPVHPVHGRVTRAIRRNCLACAGDAKEVRACDAGESCALWEYRFGVHPVTYRRVMARITTPKTLWLPGFEP